MILANPSGSWRIQRIPADSSGSQRILADPSGSTLQINERASRSFAETGFFPASFSGHFLFFFSVVFWEASGEHFGAILDLKIDEKTNQNWVIFLIDFSMDFGWISGGFRGSFWEDFGDQNRCKNREIFDRVFGWFLEGFWEAFWADLANKSKQKAMLFQTMGKCEK